MDDNNNIMDNLHINRTRILNYKTQRDNMRKLDLLKSTLEVIDHLEVEMKQSLNLDLSHTRKSIDLKNRIDALRMYVCSEVKTSLVQNIRRSIKRVG